MTRSPPRRQRQASSTPAPADESPVSGHEERLRTLGIERNGDTDMAETEAPPTNGVYAESEPETADTDAPGPARPVASGRGPVR